MPFLHGKGTTILFNEFNMSGYLNNTGFDVTVDTGETTVYGNGWKTFLPGMANATASFAGLYDPLDLEPRSELAVDSGVLTFCPGGGAAIGDRARMMSVTATNYSESAPVGDVVAMAWAVTSEATVGLGWMLHPLAEDTDTTTGAERDDTAATASGWIAQLHVIAVDAGSWVIKLQDAAISATHSDVTGGAFTAATGPTSQRLRSAASTTALRRYVRYVATRTGGTAADGITFALTYSRNY